MHHDIAKLGKQIEALQYDLNKIAGSEIWKELFRIIHFPGWTTPAEFELVTGAVAHMHEQVRILEHFSSVVLAASKQVGKEKQLG